MDDIPYNLSKTEYQKFVKKYFMDIIEQLKTIKEKNNISELYEIYDYFFRPPVSVIPIKIRKGEKIVRVRPNDKKWKHLKNTKDLFCPPPHRTIIQRANIGGFPMFYAAKFIADSNAPLSRAIVLYETSKFARDTNSEGIQRLTYSIWEVTEEMTLILVPFGENYDKLNIKLKELEVQWRELINRVNFEEDKLKICDFLSAEFSKDNSDYFFTSHYNHFACNILSREHDGVAYPTVKLEGDGLNVAIKPESAANKLRLIGASECYLIKREDKMILANVCEAKFLKNGKTKFIKRDDFKLKSKNWEALMSGLKFIN